MNKVNQTAEKIKKLQIQGARAIAVASLNCLKNDLKTLKHESIKTLLSKLKRDIDILKNARPTEPLNYNCLNFIKQQISLHKKADVNCLKNVVTDSTNYLLDLLKNVRQTIIKRGSKFISARGGPALGGKSGQNIFTHCHSSTVEKIIIEAWQTKKRFKVFNTETRPMFQGRITAKNLRQAKIPVTMVADSAASFLISDTSGKNLMMDVVLLGADAIMPDGSAINKIGSYGISLSAKTHKIPLYIVANLLKYDADGIIPIEIRAEEELWQNKPKGLKIINFAFDKIPAKYITGIICEFGIIKPKQVKKLVNKNYPWIK